MAEDARLDVWETLERVERLASASQPDAALDLLRRCVDRGMFWHPYLLQSWLPSLASLPAFDAVLERMNSLRQAADANATPRVRVVGADQMSNTRAVVILLHGGGGDIDELRLCGGLPTRERVVVAFAQSSQHVTVAKFGWIDVDRSMDDLAQIERLLHATGSLTLERIVIGGYSQGGHLAILAALQQRPFATRGFVAFGVPTDTLTSPLEMDLTPAVPSIRGWLALGVDERPWRVAQAEQLVAGLADLGVQCRLERMPDLGHAVPLNCASHLLNGIQFVLGDHPKVTDEGR